MNDVVSTHKASNDLTADEIIEVLPGDFANFFGEPQKLSTPAARVDPGVQDPPVDSGVRSVMFTDLEGSSALTQKVGDQGAVELLREHDPHPPGAGKVRRHGSETHRRRHDGVDVGVTTAVAADAGADAAEAAESLPASIFWPGLMQKAASAGSSAP